MTQFKVNPGEVLGNFQWQKTSTTRVNQKVKIIFKLRGNRDREELAHCAVLTMPVEEFSHLQYSAPPSVEWQQRGRKHGRSFARLHHRRTTWLVRFLWAEGVKSVEIHSRMLAQYGQSTMSQRKVYECVERFKSGRKFPLRKEAVHTWLREQPKSFFSAGIQKLVERHNKCIVLQGDYVEKWYVKLLTVTFIKAFKSICLYFDSPSY